MSNEEVERKLFGPGPKRILALDGGGIRGAVTIGMLEHIEAKLRARAPEAQRERFVLADYFDLIAGTSTGSIIATWLALGNSAHSVSELYRELGPKIFSRARLFGQVVQAKFDHMAFERILTQNLSEQTLESAQLRTGLLITAKRVDTGSAWILGNNQRAPFWKFDRSRRLRDLVRASAAAPSYFNAVDIHVGEGEEGLFLDGAMGGYNNPSLAAFLYATAQEYGLGWAPGEDQLYMLSLGTGFLRPKFSSKQFRSGLAARQALRALQGMIFETQMTSVTVMQALSNPTNPFRINSEIQGLEKTLIGGRALLHFERVDPPLDQVRLKDELGLSLKPRDVRRAQAMDNAGKKNLDALFAIGRAQGERIGEAVFPPSFNLV